jgi:signal transduction histidine kinase
MSGALATQYAPAERAAPEYLQEQARRFREHPLLQTILDGLPELVVILNEWRQIVFANGVILQALEAPDLETVLGLRPGEALHCIRARLTAGGCGTTEFCTTCGAVEAILLSLQGAQTARECRILYENEGEVEAMDLLVWATPLEFNRERFTMFVVTDIGHEKRRRVLERLFFHDIANITSGLLGFAELLQEADAAESVRFSQEIVRLAERLISEISAQRELLAAENKELQVNPGRINSLAFLREIVNLYTHHEAAQDRHLHLDPEAADVSLESDPTLLGRVIGNMVKNALEACDPGDTVTLGCRAAAGGVEFWVHNPNFIPRKVQLQVFQRSFSTKAKDRGLGTYSMKLLSERYLQGKVRFKSSREEGTVFTAFYPESLSV